MSQYTKKQLKIGLVWVVIFIVIAGGVYLLVKPSTPATNNGTQAKKDLIILNGGFFPTTENNYDLFARVQNPNAEWGVESINYEFDMYDSANQLIGTKIGKTFILPQETKYIIEQKFYSEKPVAKVEFKFSIISWEKLSQINDLDLSVKNVNYQILEDGSNAVVGTIENRSSYDLDTIEVAGVLFDANDNIVAAGKTSMNTVLRNESRGFELFWPYPVPTEVKSYGIKAYTNVFLNDNFIKAHGEFKEE